MFLQQRLPNHGSWDKLKPRTVKISRFKDSGFWDVNVDCCLRRCHFSCFSNDQTTHQNLSDDQMKIVRLV